MKEGKKVYWQGLEQLNQDPEFLEYAEKEFPEKLPLKSEIEKEELKTMKISVRTGEIF